MKCRVCTDHSCASCRKAKQDTIGLLRDGTYTNATVVVRGGKIAALRNGTSVFHSFSDNCAPASAADDGLGAITQDTATPTLIQSSDCIAVTGRGNSAAPYKLDPKLNPRDFLCSPDGITLKQPYAKPLPIPRDYITSVRSTTPDTIDVGVSLEGVLTVGVKEQALGIGKTRYTTFVRGACGGTYPVYVTYSGGKYHLNIALTVVPRSGTVAVAPQILDFDDFAAAIAAADAITTIDDCVRDVAGGG